MKPDFSKGLLPAIIQDQSGNVLMLGYMNQESFNQTMETKLVTFFSRSKNRIWVKGETSGDFLDFIDFKLDCDSDAVLVFAAPRGNTCHTGTYSCFKTEPTNFLPKLEQIISDRLKSNDSSSYVSSFANKGIEKIAQKVGEEAVEVVIEAMKKDKEKLIEESSDLLFHLIVLLKKCDLSLADVEKCLRDRHESKTSK